jgi:hypothetical protein
MRKLSGTMLVGLIVLFTMAYFFTDTRDILQRVAEEIENF